MTTLRDAGVDLNAQYMIGLGFDGAAVNLGSKKGLAALLKKDVAPWLVSVHCFSHRLELAVRDAFSNTYFSTLSHSLCYTMCTITVPKSYENVEK